MVGYIHHCIRCNLYTLCFSRREAKILAEMHFSECHKIFGRDAIENKDYTITTQKDKIFQKLLQMKAKNPKRFNRELYNTPL